MAPVADTLLIAAMVMGGVALVLIVGAIFSGRESQRARYYAARREAGHEASRRLALGFGLGLMAVISAGLSFAFPRPQALPPLPTPMSIPPTAPPAAPSATPTPTARAISTAVPPTPTLPATKPPIVVSPTATLGPGLTPTPTLTAAPALTSTPAATSSIVITETLLTLRAIATGVTRDGQPVNAGTEFSRGVRSIAVLFDYRPMPPSVVLSHEWLNAGKTQFTATVPFTWTAVGTAAVGTAAVGTAYVSWSPTGGMAPGLYEVHVGLNGDRQFVANFLVR